MGGLPVLHLIFYLIPKVSEIVVNTFHIGMQAVIGKIFHKA